MRRMTAQGSMAMLPRGVLPGMWSTFGVGLILALASVALPPTTAEEAHDPLMFPLTPETVLGLTAIRVPFWVEPVLTPPGLFGPTPERALADLPLASNPELLQWPRAAEVEAARDPDIDVERGHAAVRALYETQSALDSLLLADWTAPRRELRGRLTPARHEDGTRSRVCYQAVSARGELWAARRSDDVTFIYRPAEGFFDAHAPEDWGYATMREILKEPERNCYLPGVEAWAGDGYCLWTRTDERGTDFMGWVWSHWLSDGEAIAIQLVRIRTMGPHYMGRPEPWF